MNRTLFAGWMVATVALAVLASPASGDWTSLHERDTLTGGWFGLDERMDDAGLSVGLTVTQLYQANVRGGISTHRRSGRYSGRYDLEIGLDLEKLLRLPGGSIYFEVQGGWSEGINPPSVGAIMGVNALALGCAPIQVKELYYQQSLFEDVLWLRAGRLDLTGGFECRGCPGSFDGNTYANDEINQFLNAGLVNNPTIPFPEPGFGAIVHLEVLRELLYLAGGIGDANASVRQAGFNTAFHGPCEWLMLLEAGLTPHLPMIGGSLPGAYRAGVWIDGREKPRFLDGRTRSNDVGLYVSVDQQVLAHDGDSDRGLGVFARFGLARGEVNEIRSFWSAGAQYRGLLPRRESDVLAFGVAQSRLSPYAGFAAGHETAMEAYYNLQITPWLALTPSVQYIMNPGGGEARNAVALGLRLRAAF